MQKWSAKSLEKWQMKNERVSKSFAIFNKYETAKSLQRMKLCVIAIKNEETLYKR